MKKILVSLLCLILLTACDTAYVAVEERPVVGVVYYGSTPYYYSRPYSYTHYHHRHPIYHHRPHGSYGHGRPRHFRR